MKVDVELLCRRILDAIVNGGYQGLLLTGIVVVVLLFMRRTSAATRHHIFLFTLLLVALLPTAHLARSISMREIFPGVAGDQRESIGAREETARIHHSKAEPIASLPFDPGSEAVELPAFQSSSPLPSEPLSERITTTEGEPLPQARDPRVFLPFPLSARQSVGIVGAIAALVLLRLSVLGRELLKIWLLKRKANPPAKAFQAMFDRICSEMQVRRRPKFFVTDARIGPCATGFWRPAVFAPRALMSGEMKDAEPILRHELAHIARGDDWASLLQHVIAAIFFFHPAVWLLSRKLNVEREIACDDHVLAALPDRKGYALLLTEFASQTAASRWTAAPAVWRNKKQLKRRIDMILNKYRNASPRAARTSVGLISAAAVGMTLAAIGFAPQVAFAQSSDAAVAPPQPLITAPAPVAAPAQWPEPPLAPAPVLASANGAVIAVAPVLSAEPAATAPRRKARAQTSEGEAEVERRIERLERMVEQLLAREKVSKKSDAPTAQLKPRPSKSNFNFDGKEIALAQRDIDRAAKEMERAVSQSHQWQHEWNIDGKFSYRGDPESLKAHRKALRAQQKALEKQLQAIEKQLNELEVQEEKIDEQEEKLDAQNERLETQPRPEPKRRQ